MISQTYQEGLSDALDYALEEIDETNRFDGIHIHPSFYYPKILFYSKLPVTKYLETVHYTNYPSMFLDIDRCGSFYFEDFNYDTTKLYIVPESYAESLENDGWDVTVFDTAAVVYFEIQ